MQRPLVLISSLALLALAACGKPASTCTPVNCGGCCDAAGQCQQGNAAAACGQSGAACTPCAAAQTCRLNACVAAAGGGAGGGSGGALGGGTGGGATGGGTGGMAGTFSVAGRVTYDFVPSVYDEATGSGTLDFARAAPRPVRGAEVRVVEGTAVLATAHTAADGAYSLTFTSAGTGALQVQVLAKTASPPIIVQDNTSGDAIWAVGAPVPAGGGALDVHATHGWSGSSYAAARRTAAPFAVLDSMYTASLAFAAARPALVFPQLKVNWSPKNTVDPNGPITQGFLGTSFYDPATNQIYILGKDGEDTDEYDNHVIVHEYGHFFEANFSRADSLGGNHASGDVLDPRDAFSEGWGDAASAMLLSDPVYSDTYWNAGALEGFGFDLETAPTPTDDPNPGAFSESSVMRLLYDAYDSTNEVFDPLALGLGPICDAFTGGHKTTDAFTTLGSFVTALKAAGGVSGAGVDALLSHYSLGAITGDFGEGDGPLRGMYANVAALPLPTATVSLDGREAFNFKSQNKYWVFTGTGAQVTVTANSPKDVAIAAYAKGVEAGAADNTTTGTETFSFTSTSGVVYVVNLVGYGTGGSYNATLSITSP